MPERGRVEQRGQRCEPHPGLVLLVGEQVAPVRVVAHTAIVPGQPRFDCVELKGKSFGEVATTIGPFVVTATAANDEMMQRMSRVDRPRRTLL
jgi:hypothetical protein